MSCWTGRQTEGTAIIKKGNFVLMLGTKASTNNSNVVLFLLLVTKLEFMILYMYYYHNQRHGEISCCSHCCRGHQGTVENSGAAVGTSITFQRTQQVGEPEDGY